MRTHASATATTGTAMPPTVVKDPVMTFCVWLFGNASSLFNVALTLEITRRGVDVHTEHCVYYEDAVKALVKSDKPPNLIIFADNGNSARQVGTACFVTTHYRRARCVVILSKKDNTASTRELPGLGIPLIESNGKIVEDTDSILSHIL